MTKRIFLVDDDMDIVAQNKIVLEKEGYEVMTAHTAKDGEQLIKHNGRPDLLVLDVRMEYGNSGLELARKVATDTEIDRFPIVLLTSDGKNPEWLAQGGATWDYISKYLDKPINPEKLATVVKEILS